MLSVSTFEGPGLRQQRSAPDDVNTNQKFVPLSRNSDAAVDGQDRALMARLD